MKDSFTTDYKKCRENAESKAWIRFLNNVNWETFSHDELEKIYNTVEDVIVSKEID